MSGTPALRLRAAGLSAGEATRKTELFARAGHALQAMTQAPVAEPLAWFVPGRVEVLGKHTDYAGGRSLLMAVEQGICLVAAPRRDSTIRIRALDSDQEISFQLDACPEPVAGHWSNYPMTVARRIARNFPGACTGADIAFAGDLPVAAGMSSSSALVVAVFLALSQVNGLAERAEYRAEIHSAQDLGAYLGSLENGLTFGSLAGTSGVGTFGGSEDQTAILCCRPGMLSRYSFCPVRDEGEVPFPAGHTMVIGVSGITAEKAGAAREAYNSASLAARAVWERWREVTGREDESLAAAATSAPDAPDRIRVMLGGAGPGSDAAANARLLDRFNQFYEESEVIIPRAADALRSGDLAAFAQLVERSHANAEVLLRNQVPETMWLVRAARALGAVAASAFGAGFGGSVWALVPTPSAAEFGAHWLERYQRAFPSRAQSAAVLVTQAGPAALRV
ncbi:MAG TPA: galactokinase family protein [Gemmatimonadaceae bacterium]|nr:galactokinase family protein [Gemmatimonadaceae bacterium]